MRAVTETNLAVALQAEGRLDEAIEHTSAPIALQPRVRAGVQQPRTGAAREGRHGRRRSHLSAALASGRIFRVAHYNLANALNDAGRPREAAEHFRIALQDHRGSADGPQQSRIALMGEGKGGRGDRGVPSRRSRSSPSRRRHAETSPMRWASARRYDEGRQ
jgi:tetratricopeptide (TPR) repeat protein